MPQPEPTTTDVHADNLAGDDLQQLADVAAAGEQPAQTFAPTAASADGQPAPVIDYATPTPRKSRIGLIIALVVMGVMLVALAAFMWYRLYDAPLRTFQPRTGGTSGTSGAETAIAMTDPNFLGVPLQGPVVIYLIDRGHGTSDTFDGLRGAVMRSLSTLTPEMKFQIIFWDTSDQLAYPSGGAAPATPDNIRPAAKIVGNAIAFGASTIEKPLQRALEAKPSEIVIATGKFGLDDSFAATVKSIVSGKGIKVHTFALGRSDSSAILKSISDATGGTFREIDMGTMTRMADFAPTGN
jgi:hypothetical protein